MKPPYSKAIMSHITTAMGTGPNFNSLIKLIDEAGKQNHLSSHFSIIIDFSEIVGPTGPDRQILCRAGIFNSLIVSPRTSWIF